MSVWERLALAVLTLALLVPALLIFRQYRQRCACGRYRLGFEPAAHEKIDGFEYVHWPDICDRPGGLR